MDDDERLQANGARREPLDYDAFLAHRTVSRLRGVVRVDGAAVPGSLIEKSTDLAHASPYLRANAQREFQAYASGLLDELAPAVRAPRLLGSRAVPDGELTLLLEEVVHDGTRPLDAPALLAAAHDLGTMAGRWCGRVPGEPWLFTGWIDRHSQPEAATTGRQVLGQPSADAMTLLGDRLAAGLRLIEAQPRLRTTLDSLPQTLCHHDAVGANVFISSGQTVLIDWESVGPGPVGADLASLLFSSVRRGDAQASVVAAIVDDAVASYAAGVRAEDPAITEGDVRLGFDAAAGLRWKLIADLAVAVETGRPVRRGSLPDESPAQAQAELVALSDLLLASARRALSAGG
ncbi:hypothetical protein GCM10022286_04180 [Gryllotalpicola daejeonensis]|uniref:Aminoglycoside phosphotransferase domain-containing protein n=1 Tax=Gryllotalpicola daejeonensis TaxID=993087 RepID=A0ABP7ZFH0_9MICO